MDQLHTKKDQLEVEIEQLRTKIDGLNKLRVGTQVDSVDTSKQTQAATKIYEQNLTLHPTLEVVRVAWMKRALIEKKRHSSLILETSSAETANSLIKQGLVLEGEIKICERFLTDAKVTQCYRCQKQGWQ